MEIKRRKPCHFIPPTQKDLRQKLPEDVSDVFGWALLDAQYGDFPAGARPSGEGLPTSIIKLVEDPEDGNTYRLSLWLNCPDAVYALDVFTKKSTDGIATPQRHKERILGRYKKAQKDCEERYGRKKSDRSK